MKHLGNTVSINGFSKNSTSNLKRLGAVLLSVALLSACSTRIATDTSGAASVANQVGTTSTDYNYNTDLSGSGTSVITPSVSTTTTTSVASPIRCYVQRPGGYYYVGQPVAWTFGTDTGEALQVVNISSNIPWTTPPSYPIDPNFTITFHSAGVKRLSFIVRSAVDPSRVCNAGQPVNDQIVVNQGWY